MRLVIVSAAIAISVLLSPCFVIANEPEAYRYEPKHPLAIKEGRWKGYVVVEMNVAEPLNRTDVQREVVELRQTLQAALKRVESLEQQLEQTDTVANHQNPQTVVKLFVTAMESGDSEKAKRSLSQRAVKECERKGLVVGGVRGRFSITGFREVAADQTDVFTTCSNERGSANIAWLLRRDAEGWRITGIRTSLGSSTDEIVLDFEHAADMIETFRNSARTVNK